MLLLLLLPCLASSTELSSSLLHPNGGQAWPPDRPVRFSFAPVLPEATSRGVTLAHFQLEVRQADRLVYSRRVQGPLPQHEASLPPGRYRWSVRWVASDGRLSPEAHSELLVGERKGVWDGVPWRGAQGANEFRAGFNGLQGDSVELLVAALGFGYVTLNGKEVSADRLSYSGWTDTARRVLFRSYDVAHLLNASGGGELFVGLGCGYRCGKGFPGYRDGADRSGDNVAKVFRLQLRTNGTTAFHSGSDGWEQRQGPVVEDSVYDGETYIAAAAGKWQRATAPVRGPAGRMVAAAYPGVRVVRRDAPVAITQPAPGVHVVDFGSNVAGVCEVKVPRAAAVGLRHGELRQHRGLPDLKKVDEARVYFGNLRGARANDTVVTDGPLEWSPRFTYHGFRYVEVYGFPGQLTAESIVRLRMNTALEDKSNVSFEDETLQAIHVGAKESQRSNLMQLPTDCPNRDERLGWMGDASLSAPAMFLHFHFRELAQDYLQEMLEALTEDGQLPDVVPWQRFGNRPADASWSAAFLDYFISLWQLEGDLEIARRAWPSITRHMAFLEQRYKQAGSLCRFPQTYGDWCPPPYVPGKAAKEMPSRGVTSAFSMVRSLGQVAELGAALGGEAAALGKKYAARFQELKEEYHHCWWRESSYDTGSMVAQVLPLALGAVPNDKKEGLVQRLLAHSAARNGTWTGGIINNRFLFDVLHEAGQAAAVLAMLRKRDYPSYGYMYFNELEPARECMWELPDAPFQGTGMNSRNHHMYSSVGHYLITRVAGLTLHGATQRITAVVHSELASSQATVASAFGEAGLSWRRQMGRLTVVLRVPMGFTAELFVPAKDGAPLLQMDASSAPLVSVGLTGVLAVEHRVERWQRAYTRATFAPGHYTVVAVALEHAVLDATDAPTVIHA